MTNSGCRSCSRGEAASKALCVSCPKPLILMKCSEPAAVVQSLAGSLCGVSQRPTPTYCPSHCLVSGLVRSGQAAREVCGLILSPFTFMQCTALIHHQHSSLPGFLSRWALLTGWIFLPGVLFIVAVGV